MAGFDKHWAAGFIGIIPVIPPDALLSAASKIKPEDRGKVPGRLNGQGTWGGFDWLHHETSAQDLVAWARMGASVGLRAAHCPGLDIDVMDEGLADLIESHRLSACSDPRRDGSAGRPSACSPTAPPSRSAGSGSGSGWLDSERVHLVELLGDGQQYVVDNESIPPPGSRTRGISTPP